MDIGLKLRRAAQDEDGAILPFVAIASPLFILMLAFTVDMDIGRLTANKLQISADAAALAAVHHLPNSARAEAAAIEYARKNYTSENGNTRDITNGTNIETGYWDETTRTFYPGDEIVGFSGQSWDEENDIFVPALVPGSAEINAVWVRTRRDVTNDNPLPSAFASFVGIESFDIKRTSIAVANPGASEKCIAGGILSDDYVMALEDNSFTDFCVYGRNYVELEARNRVNSGAFLIMEDETDYLPPQASDGNFYVDREEQIQSDTDNEWSVALPSLVDPVIALMKGGSIPTGIADQFGVTGFSTISGPVNSRDGADFVSNRLYFVDGNVQLQGTHQNVFIVASGRITIANNAVLQSSFLASEGELLVLGRTTVGRSLPCVSSDPVTFDTYLWSADNLRVGSSANLFATQAVAKQELSISSDVTASGFFAEAGESARIDDNNTFTNCGTGLETSIGDMPDPFEGEMRAAIRN